MSALMMAGSASGMTVGDAAEAQVDALRSGHAALAQRLAAAERESDRLSMAAVALLRLYEAESAEELLATTRDLLVNLAGVEAFELYAAASSGVVPTLVTVAGADRAVLGRARFGDVARRHIGHADARATVTTSAAGSTSAAAAAAVPVASIPLLWQGVVAGVLVVDRLLAHKPALADGDIELFNLFRAHLLPALSAAHGRAAGAVPRWVVP